MGVSCKAICDGCKREWQAEASYTDTIPVKFKIKKGPLGMVWSLIVAGLTASDYYKDSYSYIAIEKWQIEILKKAYNELKEPVNYCEASAGLL